MAIEYTFSFEQKSGVATLLDMTAKYHAGTAIIKGRNGLTRNATYNDMLALVFKTLKTHFGYNVTRGFNSASSNLERDIFAKLTTLSIDTDLNGAKKKVASLNTACKYMSNWKLISGAVVVPAKIGKKVAATIRTTTEQDVADDNIYNVARLISDLEGTRKALDKHVREGNTLRASSQIGIDRY